VGTVNRTEHLLAHPMHADDPSHPAPYLPHRRITTAGHADRSCMMIGQHLQPVPADAPFHTIAYFARPALAVYRGNAGRSEPPSPDTSPKGTLLPRCG
jgi:hypothetical protein